MPSKQKSAQSQRSSVARSHSRSDDLFARAEAVLVGGVNSPVRSFKSVGGRPVFVERAAGSHIFDVDGNQYIDLVGSWGPAIVGHAHPAVVEAVQRAAADGLSFGACCAAEAELAEVILSALPGCDMIRFVNSGTEAVMSAVRLARAATNRTRILKFSGCYHGHVDAMLVAAGSGAAAGGVPDSAGVPAETARETILAEFNDVAGVERIMKEHGKSIAAIVIEPIAGNMGMVMPEHGFLKRLREVCDANGALLIFDEVMTGFRVCWGGHQVMCGVVPDITCLGKVIGGGLPVAAYAARRKLMNLVSPLGPVYQAGTLSGNPLGMAAGIATLKLCKAKGFYERLGGVAKRLTDGLKKHAAASGVDVQTLAYGGMMGLFFSPTPVKNFADARRCNHERFKRFFHAMLDRGVWLPPSPYEAMFVSSAHTDDDVERILTAAAESFTGMTQ